MNDKVSLIICQECDTQKIWTWYCYVKVWHKRINKTPWTWI